MSECVCVCVCADMCMPNHLYNVQVRRFLKEESKECMDRYAQAHIVYA